MCFILDLTISSPNFIYAGLVLGYSRRQQRQYVERCRLDREAKITTASRVTDSSLVDIQVTNNETGAMEVEPHAEDSDSDSASRIQLRKRPGRPRIVREGDDVDDSMTMSLEDSWRHRSRSPPPPALSEIMTELARPESCIMQGRDWSLLPYVVGTTMVTGESEDTLPVSNTNLDAAIEVNADQADADHPKTVHFDLSHDDYYASQQLRHGSTTLRHALPATNIDEVW